MDKIAEEDLFLENEIVASRPRQEENTERVTIKEKRLKTLTVYFSYVIHGAVNALLGATLVDLQQLLKSDTQEISTIFTWRYVGMLLGCLAAGQVADRINQHVLQSATLLMMGVALSSAPWCQNFLVFSIIIGVQGFFSGIHSVGTSAFMIDLWGKDSGPYLQALHFLVMIGATACPQLAKLFLASCTDENDNRIGANNTKLTNITELVNVSATNEPNVTNIETFHGAKDMSHLEDDLLEEFETKVQYVYLFISLFAIVGAILHIINLCCSGCDLHHIKCRTEGLDSETRQTNIKSPMSKGQRCNSLLVLGLLCLIVVFFAGLEEIFGAFLVTFSVKQLKWDISTGRDLVSVFWASAALARLISTFVSCWVKPRTLLRICTLFATVFTIAMTFTVNLTSVSIWLGTAFTGLSIGSLVATVISLGKNYLNFSGFLASVVFVSIFVGKIATPPLVGHLLQEIDHMWFLYASVIYASLMFLHYCVLSVVSLRKRRSLKSDRFLVNS